MREITHPFPIPDADMRLEQLDHRVADIRNLKLVLHSGIFPRDGRARRLFKHLIGGRTRLSYYACALNPGLRTLIWKDPMACFAAPALAARHGIPLVWCLRNPYAVAASFKRMQWGSDFTALAGRLPALNVGMPPAGFDAGTATPACKAAVLWNAVYSRAEQIQNTALSLCWINMDTLVQSPVETCRTLYRQLALDFTPRIEKHIAHIYRKREAPAQPPPKSAHTRHRDLGRINDYWCDVLSPEEIEFVATLNEPLWQRLRAGTV
jgi:hypothetical protein